MGEEVTEDKIKSLEADFISITRVVRANEKGFQDLVNTVSKEVAALRTDVHNFADEWTRRIEALESEIDPTAIRKELASLIADFVRLSR
jgi:gas vesicle protein